MEIEGSNFCCDSTPQSLLISFPNKTQIKISVNDSRKYKTRKSCNDHLLDYRSKESGERPYLFEDHSFLLLNPKDIDSRSKLLHQEVLKLYMKELPTMNYAANTGKESLFLERCVSSGKYRTLILISNATEEYRKVIAAVSYQIIPTDSQYAEIPLAAVSSGNRNKGIGCLLYNELRMRLQNVGVLTIFCWGDKESEGFWVKQGFVSVAEVDTKGRARKLPIKADIRRALCFPGGSTLMVSHLNKATSVPANLPQHRKSLLNSEAKSPSPTFVKNQMEGHKIFVSPNIDEGARTDSILEPIENTQLEVLVKDGCSMEDNDSTTSDKICGCPTFDRGNSGDSNENVVAAVNTKNNCDNDWKEYSCSGQRIKRRVWEASWSSLKSKKVKGSHDIDFNLGSDWDHISENTEENDGVLGDCCVGVSKDWSSLEVTRLHDPPHLAEKREGTFIFTDEMPPRGIQPVIMLMNIADNSKKTCLVKVVEDLGGNVTSHGTAATHVITGKARRTLNFCIALCSGAWIVSSIWLKASFREGRFVAALPFVLEDEDYMLKYGLELKHAVLKARASPGALLKGYCVCFAEHIQPSVDILSVIVKSAGGNILQGLEKMQVPSRTIFLACEESMEAALEAAKEGVWTFSSDWFMGCVMRQELDFGAPQFAEFPQSPKL